tara:strand:- start:665 stop:1186 length:522 start_codon:yes stop_codon:yes gene_type:complete
MAGSLELTKFVEVTSATANVDVTDCFNDKFDVYKITFSDATSSFDGSSNNVRFINSSGSVISSSDYDFAYLRFKAVSSFNEIKNTSQDKLLEAGGIIPNTESVGTVLYVYNPFSSSSFTFVTMQMSSMSGTEFRSYKYIGVLKDTSSITGIRFLNADGNTTAAKISVYGIKGN